MAISAEETKVETELSSWIDKDVIAQNIMDALREAEVDLTLANGQAVWLDVLYTELPGAIKHSADALVEKGEIN